MKKLIGILGLAIAISLSTPVWAGTNPEPASPAPPANEGPSLEVKKRLVEKIDLDLENASLKATIEKIATILGATPLFAPNLEDGPITIRVKAMSVSNVLDMVRSEGGVQIRLWGDRLLVSREAPAGMSATSIKGLLADPAIQKRLETAPAPAAPATNVLEVQLGGAAVGKITLASWGIVDVPGCASSLGYLRFGKDAFDGRDRVILFDGSKGAPSDFTRIVSLGAEAVPVRMAAACGLLLKPVWESGADLLTSSTPPAESREQYMLAARILEVFEDEERLLSTPRVQTQFRLPASLRSGTEITAPEGPVDRTIRLQMAVVARRESGERLLAIVADVSLTVPTPEGRTVLRIAHGEEAIWMNSFRPERITLATTRGHQPSAVVLELTLKVLTAP